MPRVKFHLAEKLINILHSYLKACLYEAVSSLAEHIKRVNSKINLYTCS